jgi:hypothetical protein
LRYIPETWESVEFNQEEKRWFPNIDADESGHYVLYEALPNNEEIILEKK